MRADAPDALPMPAPDARWALFLDLDGTLIEIAETPDAVRVPEGLPERLRDIAGALDGALAIVSGRGLDTIDRLLAPATLPAAGLHGVERRDAGGRVHRTAPDRRQLDDARRVLERFVVQHPAALLEDKDLALALHYRRDPALEPLAREAVEAALAEAGREGLQVQPGHMVFEIKSAHADKGAAIHAFLDEPPFAGRQPVFLGDDATDEHGFRVARARGGLAVRVGTPPPGSAATHRLRDPAAVLDWLARLQQRLA